MTGDFKYRNLDDNTIEITNYTGSATNITIPSTIDGYTVTSIGVSAFWYCSILASITIPNSVTSIGDYAFYNCSNLTNITIPDSVTSIDNSAFSVCSSLKSITISSSVTSIGVSAFYSCKNLTSVTIPNSVTSIGDSAFEDCSSLTSITIPNSVTSINSWTFSGCSSLTSVTIPNKVTTIKNNAFYGCSSLKSITIPDSVTSIGDYAFEDCNRLISPYNFYKAFNIKDSNLMCRGCIFITNQWSINIDNIKLCERGYHYCTNLFEIFNYYYGKIDKDIVIYECEVGDKVIESETSKCVTNKIKPVKRVYREDVIRILNGGGAR